MIYERASGKIIVSSAEERFLFFLHRFASIQLLLPGRKFLSIKVR